MEKEHMNLYERVVNALRTKFGDGSYHDISELLYEFNRKNKGHIDTLITLKSLTYL